ncbi:hypothetical protein EYF80_065261 [Liparis tanakae]|uniref:Uncharacterized protein n=1 Tax=Liparis tanakae TaxID=230148 RepID=A0A4Z2E8I2_9TELE|nr:hypothetical protein EYF80_065261 [Liparis tanakae]
MVTVAPWGTEAAVGGRPGASCCRSALLPPGGRGESHAVAQLPLRRTGAPRPDAPLRHGAACKVTISRARSPSGGQGHHQEVKVTISRSRSPSGDQDHHQEVKVTIRRSRSPSGGQCHHQEIKVTIRRSRSPSGGHGHHQAVKVTIRRSSSPSGGQGHHQEVKVTTRSSRSPSGGQGHHQEVKVTIRRSRSSSGGQGHQYLHRAAGSTAGSPPGSSRPRCLRGTLRLRPPRTHTPGGATQNRRRSSGNTVTTATRGKGHLEAGGWM